MGKYESEKGKLDPGCLRASFSPSVFFYNFHSVVLFHVLLKVPQISFEQRWLLNPQLFQFN